MDPTKAALLASLNHQRAHVLVVVESLDEDALHRPMLPSGWSCVQLLNHLIFDVERWWFRIIAAAEVPIYAEDPMAWKMTGLVAADVIADYKAEIEHADRIATAMELEAPTAVWPEDLFGSWRLPDMRALLLHVIVETACHAGHLDAARELIDGTQWLVLE